MTRLMHQFKNILEEENGPNVSKLRQQWSLLSTKLEILSKLNKEILKLTPEDNIEQEIDLADQTKEKVCSAINNIDHTLNQAGQEVIPVSDNLPSENPAQAAHTMRGSTLSRLPHLSPEPTNPSTHSHTSDTHSYLSHPLPQILYLQTHLW